MLYDNKYFCDICGSTNHPTEEHSKLELGKLTDPNYLPSRAELLSIYENKSHPTEFSETATDKYELIREVGFKLLSKEYIEALANYLTARVDEYKDEEENQKTTILEVGAGNGRLSHFLNEQLKDKGYQVIATSKEDGHYRVRAAFPVEDIDYKEALKKYNPTIVISSWMPMGQDWSKSFRDSHSVKEYILIGYEGSAGAHWSTWGDPSYEGEGWEQNFNGVPAPFARDGFEREDLIDISELQIPDPLNGDMVTVSFKRTPIIKNG